MAKVDVERIVPYSARQMFNLVADVERYPQFLPYCKDLKVVSREKNEHLEHITALMAISAKSFGYTFRSQVELNQVDNVIHIVSTDFPIKFLVTDWFFMDLDENKSELKFKVAFEFRSKFLNAMATSMLDRVVNRIASAFETRAEVLYARQIEA